MILPICFLTIFIVKLDCVYPHPVQISDEVIEIEKQRLVKFPDEIELRQDSTANSSDSKIDEAQRILQEIEKINHALGYIRKQSEPPKLPPILDSSQYLFPKPASQHFHQHNHQTSGMNGGTILIPSIRSVDLPRQYITSYSISKDMKNIEPLHQFQTAKDNSTKKTKYVLQTNEEVLPSSHTVDEHRQLPTHFAIPVRLYRLNKEEYINKNAPQQFRVKGYKIVGDVDNFYGKAKRKVIKTNEAKADLSTKYHLFFLPREFASLKELSRMRLEERQSSHDNNSREEKGVGIQRPYRIQTTATSSSTDISSNANVTTQIIRKRVIPKPLRERDSIIIEAAELTQVEDTNSFNTNNNANTNNDMNPNNNPTIYNNPSQNTNLFNARPGILKFPNIANIARPSDQKNSTPGNTIKNAFQNIFKLPFLQDNKPNMTMGELGQTLQMTAKPFFTTQANQHTQTFYDFVGSKQPQKGSDYQWEDEASSASEDEEINSTEHEQKHIFGNQQNGELKTQMEAVKHGGIIIQRLKVRKGGIAIAGPGGVATAGSGGTAIVGPGGYALTHPRSLTIAGPGAKVIAIPSSVDLKEALQRTNLFDQIIPREGKVVATGPTVYYSPPT
ncbi:PREDICTED: uncharacterized protein LOC108971654 isoform X1 [Bactrocera latifrons]|nr:PREDICTED: uncharacterized protein LOC108971654 isoform X1 [Bactrocera latifrons]